MLRATSLDGRLYRDASYSLYFTRNRPLQGRAADNGRESIRYRYIPTSPSFSACTGSLTVLPAVHLRCFTLTEQILVTEGRVRAVGLLPISDRRNDKRGLKYFIRAGGIESA